MLCAFGVALLMAPAHLSAQVDPFNDAEISLALNDVVQHLREGEVDEASRRFELLAETIIAFEPELKHYSIQASMLVNSRKIEEAVELVDEAMQRFPDSSDVLVLAGQVYALYDNAIAAELFTKALRLAPDDTSILSHLCTSYRDERELRACVEVLKTVAADSPQRDLYLANIYKLSGDHAQAIEKFQDAFESDASILTYADYHTLARLVEIDSDIEAAIEMIESMRAERETVESGLVLASLYCDDGRPEEAVDLLVKVQAREDVAWLRMALGDAFEQAASLMAESEAFDDRQVELVYARAAEQYRRCLPEVNDNDEELSIGLNYAKSLILSGKPDVALDFLGPLENLWRRTQSDAPIPVFYWRGRAHAELGQPERAETFFQQIEDFLGGADLELLEDLAAVYVASQAWGRAARVYERALNMDSDNENPNDYRLGLARAYVEIGRHDRAVIEANDLMDDPSRRDEAREIRAQARLLKSPPNTVGAIQDLRALQGSDRWNARLSEFMARALHQQGQHDESLIFIAEARESNRSHDLELLEAQVLAAAGRHEEARAGFENVAALNPVSGAAQKGLGDLAFTDAQSAPLAARPALFEEAIDHYERARMLTLANDTDVLALLGSQVARANDAKAAALAQIQARGRNQLAAGFAVAIAALLFAFLVVLYIVFRRLRAERCYKRVLELERDLRLMIRDQVLAHLGGAWDRLRDAPFSGRVPYGQLTKRLRPADQDVLDVANFGHLVAIIDEGWSELRFADHIDQPVRHMVIANLAYIADCRNAMAHATSLARGNAQGPRANSVAHMNGQVFKCIRNVRHHVSFRRAPQADHMAEPKLDMAVDVAIDEREVHP